MTEIARRALIAIGGNLPVSGHTLRDTLKTAIDLLVKSKFYSLKLSSLYLTPAFPLGSGPDYINAAATALWSGTPEEALAELHQLEHELGRVRQQRWGARNIDLDLIALDSHIAPSEAEVQRWISLPLAEQMTTPPRELILPHPRLQDRAFVLVPLCELAPEWRHPILGASLAELLDALPQADKDAIQRIDERS